MDKKKIIILTAIAGLLVFTFIMGKKIYAMRPDIFSPIPGKKESTADDNIITDFDSLYNYMLKDGIWYTQKKGDTGWINMKNALSESNYNLAISRLENHIK